MHRSLIVIVAALAIAACATTGGDAAKVPLDPLAGAAQTAALGSIVRYRDGQILRRASWDEARIATGSGLGPAVAKYLRTADGRWQVWYDWTYTLVDVSPDRITGTYTHVTVTRVDGGFRLDGRWFGAGVRMLLTGDVMTAQGRDFRRGPDGAYVNPDFPGTRIVLEGQATRLDDPPWPHLALAALAMQWGEGEALWTPP
jgi:hypothetical protein